MAYINTGYARCATLTVTKGDYLHSYDMRSGFIYGGTTYASLSNDGFAQLSDRDYERRRADFISYVYSLEPGLQTDCPDMTQGSVEYDTVLCPLSQLGNQSNEEE
ncbi:MAG: hypothetical protein IJ622_07900 [Bacteroidales bacterium]|nr:hypothetical protein [Bacteroidales bacterium]